MPGFPVTEREQALAKWIDQMSLKIAAGNDRKQVALLCMAAATLVSADENDPYVPDPKEIESFVEKIATGCKARGGKRSEAAVGASFAALAAVIAATRGA